MTANPSTSSGLCLKLQGRLAEAEDAFAKATWNRAWQGPAFYALAQLRGRAGDLRCALRYVEQALDAEPRHASARALQAALRRRTGDLEGAWAVADAETLAADPLDRWMLEERRRTAVALGAARCAGGARDASDRSHGPARRGSADRPRCRPRLRGRRAPARGDRDPRHRPRGDGRCRLVAIRWLPTRWAGCSTDRAIAPGPSPPTDAAVGCQPTAASPSASRRSRS